MRWFAVAVLLACLGAPAAAEGERIPRVVWVLIGTPQTSRLGVEALRAGLADEGFVDGRNVMPDALLVGATQINVALRSEWLAFAAEQRLPMLTPNRAGAMLSYGPDLAAIYRLAAEYVAKILAGARPSESPMQQPTQFEFVVNLKVVKAIDLTIPQSVLLHADEVIE